MGTSSSSNASCLPSSLAPSPHHPKLEGIKIKNKNLPSFTLQSFSTASPHWCGFQQAPVRPDAECPAWPDPATQAQIFSPELLPLSLICSRRGGTNHSTGGVRGVSPVLEVGRSYPLSWATLSSLHLTPCQQFLQKIKDPSDFTAGCTCQTPPLAPSPAVWPLLQTQIRANFPGWYYSKAKALCLGCGLSFLGLNHH